VQYLIVRKSDDAHAVDGENRIPDGIIFDLTAMDRSINLDDKTSGIAIKVDNEATDHLLSAEVAAIETVGTYVPP